MAKLYHVLPGKQINDQTNELNNYKVAKLMAETIMLAYIEELIRFFDDYKITKDVFDAIKARYYINIPLICKCYYNNI